MSIIDRNSKTNTPGPGAGANPLEAIVRRWRLTSLGIRKAMAGVRNPGLRADIRRLIDAHWMGRTTDEPPPPVERSEALAQMCEALLRQFDDDDAGAAEIRLVVHKRGDTSTEPAPSSRPEARAAADAQEAELVWGLRQLLASSGGMIADAAQALESRGDDVDRKGRELLADEVRAIEVDIAVLKTFLVDEIDWDAECGRLLADEVAPFEDVAVDDDLDDEDD